MSLVRAENVSFRYEENTVLENISFTINQGEYVAIIGPNGGGKTTLLKLMLGLLQPQAGILTIRGDDPRKTRSLVGYVPQYAHMDRDFPILARDVVAMGLIQGQSLFPWMRPAERKAVDVIMEALRVHHLARQSFGTLSGGEKQRVLICRALVSQPQLILLDEPTASVDSHVEADIFKLLSELNDRITIVLVTHDLGVVSSQVKKVLCVNRHLEIHSGPDLDWKALIEGSYHYAVHPVHHKHTISGI